MLTLLFLLSLTFAIGLTGCRPPGPRALLDGQRLIERGRFAEAIERLKTATSLLSTNAQAWNYLGLAYHQAAQPNDAADAYKKALSLDQNLVEVHYNLGCLWLEQNRPDLAKGELTAYTLHRGDNSPEGWIKLGEAQLALRDFAGAERSLNQARQFDAQNPEALNDIGVIEMQRNRPTEAAQYFGWSLKSKPNYGPAILNLAIVSQRLNNRQYALDRYHDYLSLNPRPANWEAVDAVARALEQELGATPVSAAASRSPAPAEAPAPAAPARSAGNGTARPVPARNESSPSSNAKPAPFSAPVEVVQVAPEPVIRAAQDTGSGKALEPAAPTGSESRPEHHGFFSRVNPVNLFRSNSKAGEAGGTTVHPGGATQVAAATPEPPVTYPRYHYRSPRKPGAGDRAAAEKAFAEGAQAQQAGQLPEAAAAYLRATKADPGYFDPYYNLGIVSLESGNLPQALLADETALAIQPDSHDARFNFALALKRGNYPVDAANEFEKLVAKSPGDANAHYALANVYAQLRDSAKAREQYEKVLQLNPAFPQAATIHQWLWANPR